MYTPLRPHLDCFNFYCALVYLFQLQHISSALYVYDITDEDSFKSLAMWYKTLEQINGHPVTGFFNSFLYTSYFIFAYQL